MLRFLKHAAQAATAIGAILEFLDHLLPSRPAGSGNVISWQRVVATLAGYINGDTLAETGHPLWAKLLLVSWGGVAVAVVWAAIQRKSALRITSPAAKSIVPHQFTVKGKRSCEGQPIQVLARGFGDKWYVQGQPTSGRIWQASCWVGDEGRQTGATYEIVAIVWPQISSKTLDVLPAGVEKSNIVHVTKQ